MADNTTQQPPYDAFSAARRHAAILSEHYDAFIEEGFEHEDAIGFTASVQRAILEIQVIHS